MREYIRMYVDARPLKIVTVYFLAAPLHVQEPLSHLQAQLPSETTEKERVYKT